ncbi:MAG: hypothetical protein HQK75_10460 [Candidatus Magnetomorum sp.]|nr:hypothetical protein [Candidatus Magnetomorum sp.]
MKYLSIVCLVCISAVAVYAYNFEDALNDIHPKKEGASSAIEIVGLLNKIFSNIRSDDRSIEFLDYLDESLQKFDFRLLYESPSLKPLDNDYRGVTLQGKNDWDHYYLGLSDEKKEALVNKTIGSFASEVGLKKIDESIVGYRSFSAYMDTQMALNQYSHQNLLLFTEGLLKIIDPENLKHIHPDDSEIFNNIQGESRIAINAFNSTFPKLAEILDRYLVLDSLLQIKHHGNIPYTHFNISTKCKFGELINDYPLIAKYLNQFRNVLQTTIVSQNMNGNKIFQLDFDCSEDFLSFSIYTKGGKIIPSDDNGDPVFTDAFSLTKLKSYEFKLVTKLLFDAYGLKYLNDSIVSSGSYLNTDNMAVLKIKMDSISKTKVYGRKYHIFPKWLIDFMIPDNIDQLIYELVTVMLHANEGEGSYVKFEFDKRSPDHVFMNSLGSSEYVDNFFIKIELGIWRNILKTNKDTIDEINALIIRTLQAVLFDLAA